MSETYGLEVIRSLSAAALSSIRTMAMFSRFTCGLAAQLRSVTTCCDAAGLSRPGSPLGSRNDAWSIKIAALTLSSPAMMLFCTNRSSRANAVAESFRASAKSPTLFVSAHHHVFQARSIPPGEGSQAASQIVIQHQVPTAEDLLRQKIRKPAVGRSIGRKRDQIVHIAVQYKEGCRARKIAFRQFRGPSREPIRAPRAVALISLRNLAPIGIEDRWRLLHLIDHARDLLQFADGGFGRLHACGDSFNLAREHIGILAIDARFHQRLNLGFDTIQFQAHELGIFARFLVVLQAQLLCRHAIFERMFDALLLRRQRCSIWFSHPQFARESRRHWWTRRNRSSPCCDTSSRKKIQSSRSRAGVLKSSDEEAD